MRTGVVDILRLSVSPKPELSLSKQGWAPTVDWACKFILTNQRWAERMYLPLQGLMKCALTSRTSHPPSLPKTLSLLASYCGLISASDTGRMEAAGWHQVRPRVNRRLCNVDKLIDGWLDDHTGVGVQISLGQ